MSRLTTAYTPFQLEGLDVSARELLRDLHAARPVIFWTDLLLSAAVGWSAFALAVITPSIPLSLLAGTVAALSLYRCLCFTHEITHLRRGSVKGFETAWNVIVGVPLLLPSFTYVGVHQSHHSLSTYGTKDDPEYLPFSKSRGMLFAFAAQSAFVLPLLLIVRFVLLVPLALALPAFHRFLEVHASSFSMNPHYRRTVTPATAQSMRCWEVALLATWSAVVWALAAGVLPMRFIGVWLAVMVVVSFVNTLRVLGAHEYDSAGHVLDRHGQLADSIDTPGGPWTELWAPVGLRYHALHHYFPGIPYHNLGSAYRRLIASAVCRAPYEEQSSRSLPHSLASLYARTVSGRPASGLEPTVEELRQTRT